MKPFKDQLYESAMTTTVSRGFSTLMAYKFGILLQKPFEQWKAFELGLIDNKGSILRKPETSEEKAAFNAFDNLVRKIRRVLMKFVGNSRMINAIIALYLLKEETEHSDTIRKELMEELNADDQEFLYKILKGMSL